MHHILNAFVSIIGIDFMHYAMEEWVSKSKVVVAHEHPRGACRVLGSG